MGKRYYCNYCDKTMVDTPALVKTHNRGLSHQKLVQIHYQQFKDPETILAEESNKKQCSRYLRGECKFEGICRFSHYTAEQLNAFREYVSAKKQQNSLTTSISFEDLFNNLQSEKLSTPQESEESIILCDNNGITHKLPWTYNKSLDRYGDELPPSLKRIRIEDFENASFTEWG